MTKPVDELEAIRTILDALQPFDTADRQRILRYVLEKLSLIVSTPPESKTEQRSTQRTESAFSSGSVKNLSTFVQEKNPKNDVQFAATVAYFHRFEAPPDKQKPEIHSDDLQDATRLAHRKRFKSPGQTLRNARNLGLLDNGSEEGAFVLNSVGENLVAMTLPSGTPERKKSRRPRAKRKAAAKRPTSKK
jgi:hypothetical protein